MNFLQKITLPLRKLIFKRRVIKQTREAILKDAFLRKKLISMMDDIGRMEILAKDHPMLPILKQNREQIYKHLRYHGIDPIKYINEVPKP